MLAVDDVVFLQRHRVGGRGDHPPPDPSIERFGELIGLDLADFPGVASVRAATFTRSNSLWDHT